MKQSLNILSQCIDKIPHGLIKTIDTKLCPPTKAELKYSMEAIIHHFKIYSNVRIRITCYDIRSLFRTLVLELSVIHSIEAESNNSIIMSFEPRLENFDSLFHEDLLLLLIHEVNIILNMLIIPY
jgi:hypothetical protein